MSSDSDHTSSLRHHTHKRKKIIISDSSSDESIIVQTRKRKKIYRVISEGETSSDEDSDVPKPVIRRQNYRVISEDEFDSSASEASKSMESDSSTTSEWQSDWNTSDEVSEDTKEYNAKRKVLSKTKKEKVEKAGPSLSSNTNISSDSGDEQLEKCPICLLPFSKQQIGIPSVCEHCFCLDCLLEWSKNINTCPVDRQSFTVIYVKDQLGGEIIKHLPVEVVPRAENQVQDDPTFCEICHQSDREDRMLLCDGCDRGYHLECLTPPMTAVPIEEWFCPDCLHRSRRSAASNFVRTLITPRRPGRRILQWNGRDVSELSGIFRILPHIHERSYVRRNRSYISRIRNRISEMHDRAPTDISDQFDPNLPSTSSGVDSIGDNSRSRSPNLLEDSSSIRSKTKSKTKTTKKKKHAKSSKRRASSLVREVRIKEFNDDGEEEEIVTYVKVASSTSRRKCKKRAKKTRKRRKHKRRARNQASVVASTRTAKRRLASTLGMEKPKIPLLVPTMKSNISIPDRSVLTNARYSAGIPQVSLFGDNLGLDYSPPESDDEYSIGNNPMINVRQRRSGIPSLRRRTALKVIANPTDDADNVNPTDLLSSIMNTMELWHSTKKKDDVILKADGTLIVNNPNKENKHSINNNESPKKEKQDEKEVVQRKEVILKEVDTPLDLSNVNPNDITQAPMYNNPCGGGGSGGGGGNRGNFRGSYSRDNGRHSGHGGQSYSGSRDSLPPGGGGRHNYSGGAGGGGPRDNFGNRDFGPPPFYNPNFEHCGGPPMFGAHAPPPPFRSRNPQHFRNERLRFPPPPPLSIERPFNYTDGSGGGFEPRPPFPHAADRFPRPRLPPLGILPPVGPAVAQPSPDPLNVQPAHVHNNLPSVSLPEDVTRNYQSPEQNDRVMAPEPIAASASARQDNDDCDIYCDIEPLSKPDCDAQDEHHSNGSMILLPPPEPPSGLLDFEENSRSDKDNDSEQELVIDDSHKEDTQKELPSGDKYDPFAADSDSNDDATASQEKTALQKAETSRNSIDSCNIPMPITPPLSTSSYHAPVAATSTESRERQEPIRLTAYDDDDDNNSQSDCPNFNIYSSQTMDVARHTEQELSQQLGPLQPPPLPPNIPDDDDIIVGDIQACDLPDVPPEPADPYIEALQKERQTLSKIPPKKISHDSHRGKIIFKIGNKLKLNNRLSNLHSEDHSVNSQNSSFSQKKAVVSSTDEQQQQQQQQQERDIDRDIGSLKPMAEVTTARSSLKSTKTDSRFSEEDEKDVSSMELVSQRESKELSSENSTDEETVKVEEKQICTDASPDRNESENSEQEASPQSTDAVATDENVAVAESTMSSTLDKIQLSSENVDSDKLEHISEESGEIASKAASNRSDEGRGEASACDDSWERESSNDDYDRTPSREIVNKADRDDKDDDKATLSDTENTSDQRLEKASSSFSTIDDEVEQFPIKKDEDLESPVPAACADMNWDSDGAYTPCKDELPVKDVQEERRVASFEVGLEPITPTKDRMNDDLDDCRTPTGYAGLGTEAISETDEAINFEEELNTLLRKEKEMEDGEILDESKLSVKECDKLKEENEDDSKRRKKKDKKEKSKESTEKNKENISSDNLVAWKKLSKSTKERPYRDKDRRSKSKDKEKEKDKDKDKSSKKKMKEVGKKKEKRKELPRYDVRKIVADKPRKDEYGRDIREKSRSRSKSRSPNKIRSGSRDRRSRSYSKGRSRSRSRLRLSWSRDRGRSYSRSCRSTSRRKSTSRTRRRSPRKRSMSRRGSLSRRHSVSRRRSRSLSRKRRSLSPRRRSRRSPSRSRDKRKDKTKKYKSRSRSRNRKRSRSKSPRRTSSKSREKKHGKRKAHSRSRSKDKSVSRDRDRNRNWEQLNEKSVDREQQFTREQEEHERSWSAQWTPSWSRSRSKTPPHIQQERLSSRNWSPPPVLDSVSPKNLTVILTNKEAIKKKKKERRKESRKSKETEKRRKGKRNRTPPPSKEVFASGDNILVSVCFNKDNETNPTATSELPSNTIPLVPPIKRRRRESVQTESTSSAKRSKKEKSKDKRSKSPKIKKDKKKKSKAAEIAATKKPVAVIDLDQSPFREQTPSPRDVIVLSDDDDKQAQEALTASPEQCPPSQASPPREQFVSQGPKTPPEPQIKFSINKQPSNLRPSLINPLLEEEEEEEEEEMMDEQAEEELEMRAQEELELRLKIGPNTPPEPPTSPPTSPDAYDPFDPTKSRSPTPDASQEATPNDEHDRAQRNSPRKHDGATDTPLPLDEPSQQQDQPNQEKSTEKPKIISMVTIKRPSPPRDVSASPVPENQTDIAQSCNSPPKTQQNPQNVQSTANPFATINPVLATVAAAVQRSFNTSTPNSTQRTLLQPNRISPSSQTKQRTNDRPQLPNVFTNSAKSSTMARSSKSNQSKNSSTIGQNGSDATMDTTNDNVVDMSSPYSPGSTLSDGLFDPPSPANFNNSPVGNAPPPAAKTNTPKVNKSTEKKDTFDTLFGGILPPVKTATKSKSKKAAKEKTKKSTNPKVGVRMDENQLQILDDLPSSAVEMQVKDKFLKKLNRQERVVEEVKLVLKPHYTKKHVTKEEYKDIMRKAVPKICHNKTGEINPKKIAHLIEAYVRKCRNNKKKTIPSTKIAKPTKTLWS